MSTPDIEHDLISQEAAKYLGISMQRLRRLRKNEKVVGHQVGNTNLYTYKIADLRNVDLNYGRRGPKPKK